MNFEYYAEFAASRMSHKRFIHTLGTVRAAEPLAKRLGADAEKARTAAVLHDITKDCDKREQLIYCERFGIILDQVESSEPKLLHPITGAAVIQYELGITDSAILDAVRYHTTGRGDMAPLEQVLWLADYIEDGRDFPGVDEVRRLARHDIPRSLAKAFDYTLTELLEKNALIHHDTLFARNYFLNLIRS